MREDRVPDAMAINDNAEVRDTASPELARIRSKIKTIHNRMLDKLNAIIHSARSLDLKDFSTFTLIKELMKRSRLLSPVCMAFPWH